MRFLLRQNINLEKQPEPRKKTEQPNPVRAENHRTEQQPVAPVPQKQERGERKKPQPGSDDILNQLEDGNQQRQSSERGRDSRRSLKGWNYDGNDDHL